MTYIPTKEGTLYLAVNIDVFSRKIVGWSMSSRMQDKLVRDCFLQACGKEHPQPGLIVHTDQGSQYTSSRYQSTLRQVGAQSSMSRKGNPYDNAMMESFYKTLKRELINDAHFETRAEATQEIFKYIETYYNTVLDNTKIDAKTIGKIKGVFLQQLTEFRVAQHDPEGYEELQPKAAFKFIGMIIEALDRNMFANRKTRKAIRKIRTSKPDKVVSKVKCLQEFSGMKSVPPINILSAKTLYAYDIKTRMLIRASTDSNHLSVKGSRIVGSVVKKKLRKPDEVLDLVRHSTERRIERMWDELTTKSSPHSGLLNPHCLIVRALI